MISLPSCLLYKIMSFIPAHELNPFRLKTQKYKMKYRSILEQQCTGLFPTEKKKILRTLMNQEPSRAFIESGFYYQDEHLFLKVGPQREFMFIFF